MSSSSADSADNGAGSQPALRRFTGDLTGRNRGGKRPDSVSWAVDRLEQRVLLELGDGTATLPRQFRQQLPAQRQKLWGERNVDQGVLGVVRIAVANARELVHRPQLVLEPGEVLAVPR